jgi:hypothetical protein
LRLNIRTRIAWWTTMVSISMWKKRKIFPTRMLSGRYDCADAGWSCFITQISCPVWLSRSSKITFQRLYRRVTLHQVFERLCPHLMTDFSMHKRLFRSSVLAVPNNRDDSMIRRLAAHLYRTTREPSWVCEVWKDLAQSYIHYLLDLSQLQSHTVESFRIDLASYESGLKMIQLIIKTDWIGSSVSRHVNAVCCRCGDQILSDFLKELLGVLSSISVFQSLIE